MQAEEPVWLSAPLQALPATNLKLLLHPTYLTQGSTKAFAVSRQRTWRGADYRRALPPPTPLFESESPHRAQAEAALARVADVAAEFGVSARRILIDSTAPVRRINVRCAEEVHADMIVVGTNGKTGISRWLAGSHAARVITLAQCPVVIVRAGATRC